jgi:AcrR family transcriptional regulator
MARRADAARNAELLVAAARKLFEESGHEVAMDEVARRAGVGNATLYRHFPTRGDLLVAAYADEVVALCDRGARLLGERSPVDALFAWLDEFVGHVAARRGLAHAATEGPTDRRTRLFAQWHDSMRETAGALLDRAAGEVRDDVTVTDLLSLANGIALAGKDPDHARSLLRLLRYGIVR